MKEFRMIKKILVIFLAALSCGLCVRVVKQTIPTLKKCQNLIFPKKKI